jgi:2'-5' RNA ligase
MGSNLVVVAIPDENDRVWKVSSEKIPHLTVLFLGDVDEVSNLDQIVQFVEHAAEQTLRRFYLPVDRRGELGADKADVLFFKKGRYDFKAIRDFRTALLQDSNIRKAYDSTTQFETPPAVGSPGQSWIPHLTLGYPTSPAKPEKGDQYPGFYDVCFHKIAVWVGDYEGSEFLLKDQWEEMELAEVAPMDVAMSDLVSRNQARIALGLKEIEAELEHYGVKGMRWGQRRSERQLAVAQKRRNDAKTLEEAAARRGEGATRGILERLAAQERSGALKLEAKARSRQEKLAEKTATVEPTAKSVVPPGSKRKTKIDVEGGENHPATEDALNVAKAQVKLQKSGAAALSNKELREVANRLQLEQQVKQLSTSGGRKFVTNLLREQGKQQTQSLINEQIRDLRRRQAA